MNTFYVTFGDIHAHHLNGYTFDHNSVGTILAEDYSQARKLCFEAFGPKFAFLQEEEPDMSYYPRGFHPLDPGA